MEKVKKVKKVKKVNFYHKLPLDVIIDIFLRLSTKSLSRFKCVSKEILNSIFTPNFHRLHYHRSSQHPFSISTSLLDVSDHLIPHGVEEKRQILLSTFDHEGQPTGQFKPEIEVKWFSDVLREVLLLPSHHNLVCITTSNHIYVCSPNKQEFVELPKGSDFRSDVHMVGFGYVQSNNEYKVFRCFYLEDYPANINNCEFGCEILTVSNYDANNNYNLKDYCSSWRVLEEGCPHLMAKKTGPALVNGSVHWQIDESWDNRIHIEEEIMSFDLGEEEFWILPVPQCVRESGSKDFILTELRGKLWLSYSEDEDRRHMQMWVLKDFDKVIWVKEYSIDLSPIAKVVYVMNIKVHAEELLMLSYPHQYYYNIKTKKFTYLGRFDNVFAFSHYIDDLI